MNNKVRHNGAKGGQNGAALSEKFRWDEQRNSYRCQDKAFIQLPQKTMQIRLADKEIVFSRSGIAYLITLNMRALAFVSEVLLDRGMEEILGAQTGIRTINFPASVRIV